MVQEVAMKLAYTIREATQASGLGRTTLWKLRKDGTLKEKCIGRRRLIDAKSLHDLVASAS
jgi:predicted DNA-binding transcriptional regulator AlpA